MCNDFRYRVPVERLVAVLTGIDLKPSFPEGIPNVPARDDIRIRDTAPIVRLGPAGAELVQRPWAWSGPTGKPVFNFRADGRRFRPEERVLIPADGFYEFTAPADPKAKRKTKWLFTLADADLFAIAGVLKQDAFAMLTVPPGPDVAPYHDRQVVVLHPDRWGAWLHASEPEAAILRPLPAGALRVEQVG